MKKLSFMILLCLLVVVGCKKHSKKTGLYGSWHGTVLIVDVEFDFSQDSYEQRTYSFNRVMVGGTKGKISVKGNVISVEQKYKFFFDNETNVGEWKDSPATYTIDYKIEGDQITLHPSTSEDSMVLKRADE